MPDIVELSAAYLKLDDLDNLSICSRSFHALTLDRLLAAHVYGDNFTFRKTLHPALHEMKPLTISKLRKVICFEESMFTLEHMFQMWANTFTSKRPFIFPNTFNFFSQNGIFSVLKTDFCFKQAWDKYVYDRLDETLARKTIVCGFGNEEIMLKWGIKKNDTVGKTLFWHIFGVFCDWEDYMVDDAFTKNFLQMMSSQCKDLLWKFSEANELQRKIININLV